MSSSQLVSLMQKYGVKVELLGTLEEPSPESLALGDMLMDIHRLEVELARVTAQRDRLQDEIRGSYGDEHSDDQIEGWATRLQPGDMVDLTDGAHDGER